MDVVSIPPLVGILFRPSQLRSRNWRRVRLNTLAGGKDKSFDWLRKIVTSPSAVLSRRLQIVTSQITGYAQP